jgi:hypothetical protein
MDSANLANAQVMSRGLKRCVLIRCKMARLSYLITIRFSESISTNSRNPGGSGTEPLGNSDLADVDLLKKKPIENKL